MWLTFPVKLKILVYIFPRLTEKISARTMYEFLKINIYQNVKMTQSLKKNQNPNNHKYNMLQCNQNINSYYWYIIMLRIITGRQVKEVLPGAGKQVASNRNPWSVIIGERKTKVR